MISIIPQETRLSPKSDARASDPRPNRRLCDRRVLARLSEKGVCTSYTRQKAVEEAARRIGARAIAADWPPNLPDLSGVKYGTPEWRKRICAAVKWNEDWIKARAAEGYRFVTIGDQGSNSPYYIAERKVVESLGKTLPRLTSVGGKDNRVSVDELRKLHPKPCGIKPWPDIDCNT